MFISWFIEQEQEPEDTLLRCIMGMVTWRIEAAVCSDLTSHLTVVGMTWKCGVESSDGAVKTPALERSLDRLLDVLEHTRGTHGEDPGRRLTTSSGSR